MSMVKIRTALQTALDGITPAVSTAWENAAFTPPAPTAPYQVVNVLFARPDNSEAGGAFQELGYMQVKLLYPVGQGASAALTRAELIRTTFRKAQSFTYSGVTATIIETPEITPSGIEDGRYSVIVKARFRSFIPA